MATMMAAGLHAAGNRKMRASGANIYVGGGRLQNRSEGPRLRAAFGY